jgi:hypothetical protein
MHVPRRDHLVRYGGVRPAIIVIQLYGFQRLRLDRRWKAEETPTFPVRVCDCDQIVFILLSISLRLDRLQPMDVTAEEASGGLPLLVVAVCFQSGRVSRRVGGRPVDDFNLPRFP